MSDQSAPPEEGRILDSPLDDASVIEAAEQSLAEQPVPVIRIGGPGMPTRTLDFAPGVTISDWLRHAGITLREGQSINVNGKRAELTDVLEPETSITITSRITNG